MMKITTLKPSTLLVCICCTLLLNLTLAAKPVPSSSQTSIQASKNKHLPSVSSLQQLISIAIHSNSELQTKKLTWESMIDQYPQAIALNDPRLVYTEAIDPIQTRLGSQDRILTLSQKFPYPGKLNLKGKIVKKDIAIAKSRYSMASRDLIVSLKKSFYELAYLQNAVRLTRQNKNLLEKISHIATTDYASKSSTLNDIAKAQSQYAQVNYDVLLLQELISTEKTRINTLLNRSPEQDFRINPYLGVPAKLRYSINQLYQFADSNDEIKIANENIAKSRIKKDLSRYASLPDFDLGIRYTQIGDPNIEGLQHAGKDGIAVSVGLNIPLNQTRNKAIKHQAYLERQRNIANKKALINGLRSRIKSTYFKINNAYRQATLYHRNLIPQAQRAKHIAELQYRENKGSISQYLETQSTWLNFQLAYQRAVADYWKSLAEMEKLTGKTL